MFPASSNGGGQCACFPDVCKTPSPGGPVPVPYPNIAMLTAASGGTLSKRVRIKGKKAVTTKTQIRMSSGDEPGTLGGVISSRFKGPAKFKQGSSRVKVEGSPMVFLTSMIGQNGVANANHPAGAQVSPSQATVLVSP